jgi:hypothetical protein
LYIKIGQLYWDGGGKSISAGINQTNNIFATTFDNISTGLINIDQTIIFALHNAKVRIRMAMVMLYNNGILIKDQIITWVLTFISKFLNILLIGVFKLKTLLRKTNHVFKTSMRFIVITSKSLVLSILRKLHKTSKDFESNVLEEQKDKID